tara:strand:- start:312 stop:947 length:636 start_codon:yes stop_codon:yes gene_type:complete
MSFKKNKYKILRGAVSVELTKFIYSYFLNRRSAARFLFDQKYLSPYNTEWGVWNDAQVPNTYTHYSDTAMETLLPLLNKKMNQETGLKLSPTYSFARIYKKGDVLVRHKDRDSCEVSTTIHLGGEPWPIYLDPTGKEGQAGIKVDLEPGDMLIYSGCELEHWREEFTGKDCGQVFLHYNNLKGKNYKINKFDRRPMLGLPTYFKGFTAPKK